MKCIGCGVNLQTTDPDKKGYVGEIHIIENGEQVYCKRCFDIIHYNRRYVPQIDNKAFEDKMNKIRTNNKYDVVLLLVDVLDIYSGLSKEIAKLIGNLKVIILINKIDLMPKSGFKCNYNVFFFLLQNYFRFRNYQCCLAVLNY